MDSNAFFYIRILKIFVVNEEVLETDVFLFAVFTTISLSFFIG
ncbi:hypothetical protein SAMN02910453_0652 [Lachnospiraceae bacterium A10]|nr:hypothetical protein SAMN02910453_0652 [Lachnospiraceae bacterium A10]